MNRPLYRDAVDTPKPVGEFHRGLWFERFVDFYEAKDGFWEIPKPKDKANPKSEWIKGVAGECGSEAELRRHALYLAQRMNFLGGEFQGFETDWHFATGLGNPHPVENGFLWHPTLGVPYLPGSAVKGLVRAWVERWDDSLPTEAEKRARCLTWFGTETKDDVPKQAGELIFFDALPIGPVTLALDVMTPHYGKWYEQGGEINTPDNEPEKVPADWHDPVPVPFLVVKQARFVFAIAPRRPEFKDEARPALDALAKALDWLGAGAKTAVGYGRMVPEKSIQATVQGWADDERQQREAKQREVENQRRWAVLSPLEREMEEAIEQRQDKNLAPYMALIQAIEKNCWQGEDKRQAAAKVRDLMQREKGQWKEKPTKDKPEKDKEYQRTLKVKGWLGK
jgi:CRISPR-associated protein Cmr6